MVRVPTPAESGLFALIRGTIARGGPLAVIAEALYVAVRPPPAPSASPPQLALWIVDAEDLPPRPWRVYRETIVPCAALHGDVPAHVCVARQVASEAQRTTDVERGQAPDYPHCQTALCAQGRGIRAALDPSVRIVWRGAGPNGRFDRGRGDAEEQRAAFERKRDQGLLDEPPSLDAPPPDVPSEEEA